MKVPTLTQCLSVFLNGTWHECLQGTYLIIPGGTPHDFENRSAQRSGILSFNNKAGFENQMPSIVEWFKENPPENLNE